MSTQERQNHIDIGLDKTAQKGKQRSVNADGSYNMVRIGANLVGIQNLYHWIITTTWTKYWLSVIGFYGGINFIFASIYYLIGPEELNGMRGDTFLEQWLYCFFFSAQSFTTVGYGGIHPIGIHANLVAVTEAFFGLMTFALATGTLYGRFSKPISKIKYSPNIIIAPYKKGKGLQFMIANELNSNLMEMEAKVNISWQGIDDFGKPIRKFQLLTLEIEKISMFPTSWTINHPIAEGSILYNKSEQEIRDLDIEVFVLLKGFDDAFSQTIYNRHSYIAKDLVWGAKFKRPFYLDNGGKTIMDLNKVGHYEKVDL